MTDRKADVARIQLAVSVIVRNIRNETVERYVADRAAVPFEDFHDGILPFIYRSQPVRISDLAQMMQLETTTISRRLAGLDRQGIIRRDPHPIDGRSTLVSLSPKGEAIFGATSKSWLATFDEGLEDWDDNDVIAFSKYLLVFSKAFAALVQQISQEALARQADMWHPHPDGSTDDATPRNR
jgi:DNA-binding MarR family transcriptional regulator